jgi:hypothetical protein
LEKIRIGISHKASLQRRVISFGRSLFAQARSLSSEALVEIKPGEVGIHCNAYSFADHSSSAQFAVIAKTLLPSDDEEEEQEKPSVTTSTASNTAGEPQSPTKGVKEDIFELTQTLTRQFRGIASFLAPPPQSQSESKILPEDGDDVEASDELRKMSGIRNDFVEIWGRVRSEISKISEHVVVSEIAKIASSFLALGSDEDEDAEDTVLIGVTEEVLMFVENISMHPGTWLVFLLFEEECDDFEMLDVQQEHALAIKQLVLRLG